MSFEQMHLELAAQGYRPGDPSALARAEDAAVAAGARCAACGHGGLTYHSYINRARWPEWGYRALAVCPVCREAQEF